MNLHECENLFASALLPTASAVVFSRACEMFVEHGNLSSRERLLIYRHNISGGFINALALTFQVCEEIVGKACFATFARDYAWNNSELSGDLNKISKDFPRYLEYEVNQHPSLTDYAYLSDLAKFEWLIEQSMQACTVHRTDLVDTSKIEEHDPESLNIVINNSLELFSTAYPIFELWNAHKKSQDISLIQSLDEQAYLCICRDESQNIVIRHVNKEHFELLLSIKKDASLYRLLLNDTYKKVQFLQLGIQYGWLLGFRVSTGSSI